MPDQPLSSISADPVAAGSSTARRILIVRLGAMGDVIHALPAAAAIRGLFPAAEIGWVIERRWMELLGPRLEGGAPEQGPVAKTTRSPRQPLVDRIHVVDTFSWRAKPLARSTRKAVFGLIDELRQAHYDACIDFQGSWKSATVARLSGTRLRIGFRHPREAGVGVFYNRAVAARGAHVVEQNLSLVAGLESLELRKGAVQAVLAEPPPTPVLPEGAQGEDWLRSELARRGLTGQRFAVINPGAGWGAKCWPAERYGEVARSLGAAGLPSLINYGPGEESLAQAVEATGGGAARPITCTVGQLITLLGSASLFVGGDTGPMHLAAALRVPAVGLFGPTDPARNGPYGTNAVILRRPASVTDHSRRAATEAGLLSIGADEVIAAARRLLDVGPGGRGSQPTQPSRRPGQEAVLD
jgi:heptosyltransferase-1